MEWHYIKNWCHQEYYLCGNFTLVSKTAHGWYYAALLRRNAWLFACSKNLGQFSLHCGKLMAAAGIKSDFILRLVWHKNCSNRFWENYWVPQLCRLSECQIAFQLYIAIYRSLYSNFSMLVSSSSPS